jgi:hypothetical protein
MRSITDHDRTLRGLVNDTISSRPIVSKPKRSAARAPSLA